MMHICDLIDERVGKSIALFFTKQYYPNGGAGDFYGFVGKEDYSAIRTALSTWFVQNYLLQDYTVRMEAVWPVVGISTLNTLTGERRWAEFQVGHGGRVIREQRSDADLENGNGEPVHHFDQLLDCNDTWLDNGDRMCLHYAMYAEDRNS